MLALLIPYIRNRQVGRVTLRARRFGICQLTACRGLPALPQLAASSRSPSRGRRARCFSSGFHHCGPNRAHPLYVCTSRSGGARRTPLLNRCFSFHGSGSFSNSGIRHRSALDIRFARFRRLRNSSVVASFRGACPSRSHLFKRECCRDGLLFARLGFAWRWCRGF